MRTYMVPLLFLLPLSSCAQIGQALGLTVISVENSTDRDGFEVFGNGEKRFTLNAGDKKSFSVNGADVGSVRVVVRHQGLSSDLIMTMALLHEFYRVYPCRMLFFGQLLFSTLYDWGLPRWIMD